MFKNDFTGTFLVDHNFSSSQNLFHYNAKSLGKEIDLTSVWQPISCESKYTT